MARARRAQRRCCVGRPWLPFSRFTTHARMMLTRDWRVAGAVWGRSTPAHSTTARRARSRPLSDFGRLSRLDWIRSSRTDRASRIRPGGPPGSGPAQAAAPPPSAPGIVYFTYVRPFRARSNRNSYSHVFARNSVHRHCVPTSRRIPRTSRRTSGLRTSIGAAIAPS